MVEHFVDNVVNAKKLRGKAKGMIVTQNIETAIRYYKAVQAELARRGSIDQFVKVKGHAKDCDVRAGRVLPIDKLGNDGADALAVAGAETHAVPDDVLALCRRRTKMARASHYMMLRILKARAAAEQTLRGEVVEQHGDDLGDDPWSELDTPMYVPHPGSGEG